MSVIISISLKLKHRQNLEHKNLPVRYNNKKINTLIISKPLQINFMSNVCKVFLIAISNQNALIVLIKIKKQINEGQKNTETVFA